MIIKISTFLIVELIFFLHFYTPVITKKQNKLRFCAVNSFHTHNAIENVCRNLVQSKSSKVECIIETDRTQCLKLLINDQADFMSAEPEDLIVLALNKENNNKILVTHELRVWENEYSSFKTVVVVRKDIENLWHTENRRLCLPGFEKDSDSLDYIKFLETKFVFSDCSPEKSLLENRLSALSQYFESACISGPWTNDERVDMRMKKKYGNLCSRCENSLKCSADDKFYGKEGVLMCLTEGGGDIAWTRLDFVRQHFKRFGSEEDYRFLCPDGSSRKLTDDPCIWFEEPWRTTIARKIVAEKVSRFISDQNNQVGDFLLLLQYDIHRTPVSTEGLKTPEDYLKLSFPDYYSLKDYLQCKPDRRIKWCVTTNLEVEKCNWLSYAANSYGIEPLIQCVQELNRKSCLESIKNKMTDIFVVNSSEEFEARIAGLRPIIQMVTKKKNETAALVQKFSDLKLFKDLKNRKACFSGYRDIGWNTFIYLMRNFTGDNNWYCNDKEMVSKFFKESCVFHLNEQDFSSFPKNLYSLCSHLNFNTLNNSVISCLDTNIADVSFLHFNSETQFPSKHSDAYYRTLCSNEFMYDFKQHECFLSWSMLGSIMVNKNISSSRVEDISLLFMDLNRLFGETYQGSTPLMSLYGPFQGKMNILFSEFTEFMRENKKYQTLSYNEVMENFEKYRMCNEADSLRIFAFITILLPIIIYLLS